MHLLRYISKLLIARDRIGQSHMKVVGVNLISWTKLYHSSST